jgi:hypothetical protein
VVLLDVSKNPLELAGTVILSRMLDCRIIAVQFLEVIVLDHCLIPDLGGQALVRSTELVFNHESTEVWTVWQRHSHSAVRLYIAAFLITHLCARRFFHGTPQAVPVAMQIAPPLCACRCQPCKTMGLWRACLPGTTGWARSLGTH